MSINETLKRFMAVKKKKTDPLERYNIPEFLEFLLPSIKSLYMDLIDDNEEEFSDRIRTLTAEDQLFYTHYFEPYALFYTYLEVHRNTPISDLLLELFTLGKRKLTKIYTCFYNNYFRSRWPN